MKPWFSVFLLTVSCAAAYGQGSPAASGQSSGGAPASPASVVVRSSTGVVVPGEVSPMFPTGTPQGRGAFSGSGLAGARASSEASGTEGSFAENVEGRTAVPGRSRLAGEERNSSIFQRFVQDATGQRLPIFGANFFQGAARGFEPVQFMPVPAEYVVGPGDELVIRGWGRVDIDVTTAVDRNGQIAIPRVGMVNVAGTKAGDLDNRLKARIGQIFKGFDLSVTLGRLRSIQVFVVGHARQPGGYTISGASTLVNAVFASGGPSEQGSLRRVQLKRQGSVVGEFDLYDFIIRGDQARDIRLLPGDVIVYLPVGARVALTGAIDNAALYELPPGGQTLRQLLADSGGARAVTNATTAQLERIDPSSPKAPRSVLVVQPASDVPLRDGDIVTFFNVAPQFANAVTLRGNVAAPLRYPHMVGMRISDLIPEREALLTPDYFVRKNRLVQFIDDRPISLDEVRSGLKARVDEPNWEYATVERLDGDRIRSSLIPFHLGKAVLERDPSQNLVLLPGDIVTIFGSKDLRSPAVRRSQVVRVEGEVDRPGVYQLLPGETLRALLARAGGATPQAYIFGIEFSRESTRERQKVALQDALRRLEASLATVGAQQAANLASTDATASARLQAAEAEARRTQLARLRAINPNGRIALELEPRVRQVQELPDIPLEDGDSVFVPSRPGFVFAVGSVANENALLWREGRTVRDYLRVAGLLPEADIDNYFVVRADGSVRHSRDASRGFLFGGDSLERMVLAPGDTIVVPDKLDRESAWSAFVRGAKDWTQILSNFGIAAAAIKTLSN